MLVRPTIPHDPKALASDIERLRSASDPYFQGGIAGLIAQHGQAAVKEAMSIHVRTLAATAGANVVAFTPLT